MRNRSTMVSHGPNVCFCKVATPDGRLFKFKGNYIHLDDFKKEVTKYFSDKIDANLAFNLNFIIVRKTNSYHELDEPSVIEI